MTTRYENGTPVIDKDPNALLQYGFDLTDWIEGTDTITSVTVEAAGGVVVESSGVLDSGTKVYAVVSGGTVDTDASVTFRFTTIAGFIDDRTLKFRIVER